MQRPLYALRLCTWLRRRCRSHPSPPVVARVYAPSSRRSPIHEGDAAPLPIDISCMCGPPPPLLSPPP
ncbi:translation initiation factor EIF-2B gamma subunit, putative, partial [Leishmania donovani]